MVSLDMMLSKKRANENILPSVTVIATPTKGESNLKFLQQMLTDNLDMTS